MDERTVDEIREWEATPFDGGYEGLHGLADQEFSGVANADDHWLFFVNGQPVAVVEYDPTAVEPVAREGEVEAFDGVAGTAYRAPAAGLALLYAMKTLGGETRGSYYTEETLVADVDETLRDGGFTGYLELTENVLSGDYYVVYHGGRPMSLALVGAAERLHTGEEAFELAADEVGIYEVVSVDLTPVTIPEPPASTTGAAAGGASADETNFGTTDDERSYGTNDDEAGYGATDERGYDVADDEAGLGSADDDDSYGRTDDEAEAPAEAEAADEASTTGDARPWSADASGEDGADDDTSVGHDAFADDADEESGPARTDDAVVDDAADVNGSVGAGASAAAAETDRDAYVRGDEGARDADDEAYGPAEDEAAAAADDDSASAGRAVPSVDPALSAAPESEARADDDAGAAPEELDDDDLVDGEDRAALRAALIERREEVETLREHVERLGTERDRLAERVEELEAELAAGRGPPSEAAGVSLTAAEARGGTNLFVRYRSKGEATLQDVPDGAAASAVAENIRIEHHTTFESEGATVDGRPFEAFLEALPGYRFLQWLVGDLVYEIRATRNERRLEDLYRAIQEIDRVEFDSAISVDGESRTFDFVARDKMGRPLVVASLDDSREPTTEGTLADLAEGASDVSEVDDRLAAAFAVTASYFEPGALALAEDATAGSLLSRDRKASFVRVSRKRGFHLGLVEGREGSFNLSVPDL